jgi:hypothetical protein
MNVETLSPPARELLVEAMPHGELTNVLYRGGERLEGGFSRERRCFALGERGWLDFLGFDGAPGSDCGSRWALTLAARTALLAH